MDARDVRSPGARIIGNCKPPNIDSGLKPLQEQWPTPELYNFRNLIKNNYLLYKVEDSMSKILKIKP